MEPHESPDMSRLDSPDDELRQIALDGGLMGPMVDLFVRLVHKAGSSGVTGKLGYGEYSQRAAHELLRRTLAVIGDGRNAALRCWCLDFLAGTNVFGGKSETEIGRRWGYTRSNVSYIVKELQAKLGMLGATGGKDEAAVVAYRVRAKASHDSGKMARKAKPFAFAANYQTKLCPN